MGILPRLRHAHIDLRRFTFLDADGIEVVSIHPHAVTGNIRGQDLEVGRGDLTAALYTTVRDDVEFLFDDSIDTLDQSAHGVEVTFRSGNRR
jgi:2-polyprenyl-6-methoxyphenol hydroxylase-like FAD-dependent oxidoreductase